MKPVIFGLSGPSLTSEERDFFRDADPAGYILFGRNIDTADQIRALTDSLRSLHGRDDLPILIDQEGGRVVRMKPPIWPAFPAAAVFDALYDIAPITAMEAARANAEAMAVILNEAGITVNCSPVLDVRVPDTHSAIGDRALGSDPMRVAALGRAVLDGLSAGGVIGVVKHMPGQGRANVDSHHSLPRVTADAEQLEQDIAPFRLLNDAPMGMTGHVMFDSWDREFCATMSEKIIGGVIRGSIGFDGLLISDDLDMAALSGDVGARAADCVAAGCDIALNCWGRMDEMIRTAAILPDITDAAKSRLDRAMVGRAAPPPPGRLAELLDHRDRLLAAGGDAISAKLTHGETGASHGG